MSDCPIELENLQLSGKASAVDSKGQGIGVLKKDISPEDRAAPDAMGKEAVLKDIDRGRHGYAKYALLMAGFTARQAYLEFEISDERVIVPNHLVRKAQKYIADFDEALGSDTEIPF